MSERSSLARAGDVVLWATKLFLLLVIASLTGCWVFIDVPVTLAVGWIGFLARVLPGLHANGWAIATFLVTAVGVCLLGHAFASWWHRSRRGDAGEAAAAAWRWRWTLSGVVLLVLMFVNGIAAVGAFHQAVWFASSRPFVESTMDRIRDADRAAEFCVTGWPAAASAALDPRQAMEAIWSSERFVLASERWNALPRVDAHGTLQSILILPRDAGDFDRVGGFVCRDARIVDQPRGGALARALREIH